MLFSSLEFIFLFLPIVVALYFIVPRCLKNYLLLAASLLFYAWGEPRFVLIMVASIAANYLVALAVDALRSRNGGGGIRIALTIGVLVNLGILFSFKYLNFVTGILHDALPFTQSLFPQTEIRLPIGISFFTFQALSYIIDVFRGNVKVQKNPLFLGLYIAFFPQLIAGPIVRYSTIEEQISNRSVNFEKFSAGATRFARGFCKKILLANSFAVVADIAFAQNGPSSAAMAWLGAIAYTLQIFYDFSGYSDMAIGLGKIFGFDFLENFNYPYISRSISEFWRRWHISLGTWFRDYLYFPLGGSRVGNARLVLNLAIVWTATGVWHGASWNFICWGALYGVLIIFEKLTNFPEKLRIPVGIWSYQIFTMICVIAGWILFRATDLSAAGTYFARVCGNGVPWIDGNFQFYVREYAVYLIFGILFATPIVPWLKQKLAGTASAGTQNATPAGTQTCGNDFSTGSAGPLTRGALPRSRSRISLILRFAGTLFLAILFLVSVAELVMGAHNPFIYFNF